MDTVKEVLDVIRLVTHINRVVTLVAIDERMAFAAVERHYQLFGHAGRAPALVARDYLAKVLQVSLTLPELDSDTVGSYVDQHIFGDIGSQDAPQIQADNESEEQPVQAALRNNRTEAAHLPESQCTCFSGGNGCVPRQAVRETSIRIGLKAMTGQSRMECL